MPCMTHVISMYYGKFQINGPKKLGTMMLCMTCHFGNNTSSCIILRCLAPPCIILHCLALPCIVLHCLASSCIILHHVALPCIVLHCLASSCIILHHLASSCIILHHLAQIQLQPKFARPRLWWSVANEHRHDHYAILEISRTAPTETSRNATNVEDIRLSTPNILQTFSVHIRILMFKKAQYHDAMYNTCISFYYGKFHINGPKKLGTMMQCMK